MAQNDIYPSIDGLKVIQKPQLEKSQFKSDVTEEITGLDANDIPKLQKDKPSDSNVCRSYNSIPKENEEACLEKVPNVQTYQTDNINFTFEAKLPENDQLFLEEEPKIIDNKTETDNIKSPNRSNMTVHDEAFITEFYDMKDKKSESTNIKETNISELTGNDELFTVEKSN